MATDYYKMIAQAAKDQIIAKAEGFAKDIGDETVEKTKSALEVTGFLRAENIEELTREMGQVQRATHVANVMGETTDSIIRCVGVFKDPESPPTAKAASVLRCIAAASSFAALLGPEALIATAILGVISMILEAVGGPVKPLEDKLNDLIRKVMAQATGDRLKAAQSMMKVQIAALEALDDKSQTFASLNATAPLTHDITQFEILVATEWLKGSENQANELWEEVLLHHVRSIMTVLKVLTMYRLKIENRADAQLIAVNNAIRLILHEEFIQIQTRARRLGHFWHVGDKGYAYISKDLDKPWQNIDWTQFSSIAVAYLEDTSKDVGWGCTDSGALAIGSYQNDMRFFANPEGYTDVSIAENGSKDYRLLIVSKGKDGNRHGRLVFYKPPGDVEKFSQDQINQEKVMSWESGTIFEDDEHDLLTARYFKSAQIYREQAPKIYLLAKGQSGFYTLGYIDQIPWIGSWVQKPTVKNKIMVGSDRFAVSKRYLFYIDPENTTIRYCLHSDYIDSAPVGQTLDPKISAGSIPFGAGDQGGHKGFVDIFACADDHVIVVLKTGQMWSVSLALTTASARDISRDKWNWTKIEGSARRVFMRSGEALETIEALREIVQT